ncbi:hypothetical protein QFB03_00375 [Enterococcus faecalis]|nr:hypothetical protein [Enterococcus faecalis]EJR6118437.1 hypothetical protein [Enterococcus faecalis]MDH5045456.1 hypothetical protein [Enterococcus faecalis]WIV63298.1 hypothetical protein QQS48_08280 [Enterococcus faecalis]
MNKRGLAAIAKHPRVRMRRVQEIAYVSLIGNVVFLICIFAMAIAGR